MKRIGVRELRQHASKWLQQVQQGESFEITDRGRPVALLVPPTDDPFERMIAEGRIRPAQGDFLSLGPPLPAEPGKPTLSQILAEDRAQER